MKGTSNRSGPAPDPNALRRDRDGKDWISLPPVGRTEPAPKWPLTRPSSRELGLWASEWARPQAIMWEINGQELEVALYVRSLVAAERNSASVASRTLIRQQQEALGLSIPGLARNHWRIAQPEVARPRARRDDRPSARERLKLLAGGGG
jgi:hypothetical protein